MSDKLDTHDLVSAVQKLASELGRSPKRVEFEQLVKDGNRKVQKFGSFAALLQAAGLDTYEDRRSGKKKAFTREEVYGADLEQVLTEHVPRIVESNSSVFEPVLAIGDTHFPFSHQKTIEKVYRFAEKEQPAHIVQVGDLKDQWSHGRFPSSRNYYKPDEEMELAHKQSVEFWEELRKACPKAKCYQIMGNHDLRPLKLILNAAPSLESLVAQSIEKLYDFEGVTTVKDYREELIIQNIMFHHGYMSRHGQQRDYVMQNLVSGHTHRGAVLYRPLKDKTIWHLDCGFVGDPESKALSYTPQKTTNWTLGWGWIDEYGPRFIPA
jgi:metallophosphoesterase superfamily enzyme